MFSFSIDLFQCLTLLLDYIWVDFGCWGCFTFLRNDDAGVVFVPDSLVHGVEVEISEELKVAVEGDDDFSVVD